MKLLIAQVFGANESVVMTTSAPIKDVEKAIRVANPIYVNTDTDGDSLINAQWDEILTRRSDMEDVKFEPAEVEVCLYVYEKEGIIAPSPVVVLNDGWAWRGIEILNQIKEELTK